MILLLTIAALLLDIRAAVALLLQTDWRWVLLCLVVVQLQIVLSAYRWHITAVRLGQALSVPRAIREYYLATLANMSLPGGIVGDAGRVYRNRQAAALATAAQSVMLERMAGQVALIVVTIIGCMWWVFGSNHGVFAQGAQILGIVLISSLLLIAVTVLVAKTSHTRVSRFIKSFGPAMRQTWLADRQWLRQGVLSLLIVVTYLIVFACCAAAVQQPLPAVAVLTIVPLVLLSMVVPLSVGGWGVREAAAAALWPLIGLSAEAGLATSVLYGVVPTRCRSRGSVGWPADRASEYLERMRQSGISSR